MGTKVKALKKITTKTVVGTVPANKRPENGAVMHLYDVWGQARRMQQGETEYGPYTKFKGSFEAVAAWGDKAGELVRAPNMILHEDAADALEGLMSQPGVSSVDFAFRVSMVGDETNIGFHYQVDPILEGVESDPLSDLRAKLTSSGALTALPAPEADKTETGEQTEAAAPGKGKKRNAA